MRSSADKCFRHQSSASEDAEDLHERDVDFDPSELRDTAENEPHSGDDPEALDPEGSPAAGKLCAQDDQPDAGNSSGRSVDKFEEFGLTRVPAMRVAAPLIAECFANLECKVIDTRLVNAYNLFILEVVAAWIDPACKQPKTLHHRGMGRFVVDGETIQLPSRMP